MHGLGNDFVIIDKRVNKITITKELISKLSDRKSGAGCDQLITINNSSEKDNDIDAEIKIYNPSGDQAEACGNGTRCVAKLLFEELNKNEEFLLAVTSKGFGKRSSAYEYRISNRGGKGITGILTSEKNGEDVDCFVVQDNDEIILVSDKGQIIRVNVNQIRIAGRSTKGVSIFKIPESDRIVSVSRIQEFEND